MSSDSADEGSLHLLGTFVVAFPGRRSIALALGPMPRNRYREIRLG